MLMDWCYMPDSPAHGNMRMDEAMQERDRPALRLYTWQPPAITLGSSQDASILDEAACREHGLTIVPRFTGGAAVLHLHDLTYAFFYPAACEPRLRAIDLRVRFRHAFLEAFAALGVEAEASHGQTWRMPDSAVCFHGQAEHEILIAGRKVAGNAQRVSRRGIFQHGSILFENTEELFCRLVRPARWTGTVTGLREHVPGATPDALAPLLAHTVARAFDLDPVPVAPAAFG